MNWHSRLLLDSHENADIVKFLIAIASGTEPALAFEDMIQVLEVLSAEEHAWSLAPTRPQPTGPCVTT